MEVQLIVQRRHGKSEVPVSRKELIDMLHDRPLVTRQVWSFAGESPGTRNHGFPAGSPEN